LHQGCGSIVLAEIVRKYRIIVATASVLGRHNPSPTDIPDEDQSAASPRYDDVRGIERGARRRDVTDMHFQSRQ
jgi:hypothetical protein